ncbi:MAG: pyridoxal phosphate-dependent aminotransferase [Eubacteriales bacterium]|nr:pyridoxal phosphate-dependent aminotransferase [Eubacteriales bacterium]
MISDKMKPLLNNNSTIRAMFEEGMRLRSLVGEENVFDFSLGNPNVPAPKAVGEAIKKLVDTVDPVTLHGYMPNAGFPDVREKLADHLNRLHGTSFTGRNLIMTVGAASGLNILLRTLLNEGDEVIVFTPYFMEYGAYARNYGGTVREVPTDQKTFLPDMEAFRAALNARTKVVIINTPNNPTGVIYGEEVLKALAAALKETEEKYGTDIVLLSDEPYRELAYDGTPVPYVTKFYHNTIVCYSYSKSLSLAGERIGYLLIPDEVTDAQTVIDATIIANRTSGMVNAPALMQKTVAEVADTDISGTVSYYDRNRTYLYDHLTRLGFDCVYPAGAFYLWMKAPIEEKAFVELCKKHYVLVVPGSSFSGPGCVRIAYCVSYERLCGSIRAWEEIASEVFAK